MNTISPDHPWMKTLIATGHRMGIPFTPLSPRRRTDNSTAEIAGNRWVAICHLRTGEEIVLEVDKENKDYIYGCLAKRPKTLHFMWFETGDGCLVGINLAATDAVGWMSGDINASVRSPWKRDCVVMRFSDGTSMELPEIRGETIEYLKGATIRTHPGSSFHSLSYADGSSVSINLETLMCVTMPAVWLDDP